MVYIPGDHWVICDRCGFKVRRHRCRKTWDNLLVCSECWEPRHPQDFVKSIPNPQTVPDARPRPTDVFGCGTSEMVAGTISTQTYAINRLWNGDFEDGDTSHWQLGHSATLAVSTSSPYKGSYCLKITENGENYPNASQTVTVLPNIKLRCTGRVKAGTCDHAYPFLYDNTNQAAIVARHMTSLSTSQWKKFEFDITVPAGCIQMNVALEQRATKDQGTYLYYDAITLETI